MVDKIEGVVELEEHPFNETEELHASLRANANVLDFVHLYLSEEFFHLWLQKQIGLHDNFLQT